MTRNVVFLLALLTPSLALAQDPDPGYTKAFGAGSIAASAAGYPELTKYDPAQFEYKDKKFFIETDGHLELRAILAKGTTIGKAVTQMKKERGANLKYKQSEFMSFRIWASFDQGQDQTKGKPWPTKLADVPEWGSPIADVQFDVTTESQSWTSAGARWDNIKSDMSILHRAQIGHKFYVVFSVGYRYKTPGGQMESKWDDVLHRFTQQKSLGLVGFVYGPPLAASTIEIGAGPDQSARLIVSDDGVTDSVTHLTWAKSPTTHGYYIDVPDHAPGALSFAKSYKDGTWRLPTMEELLALRKIAGAKPAAWLNAHGFTGVRADPSYWTTSMDGARRPHVVDMGSVRESGVMDTTDDGSIWPVKGP
jgi:hypothetical protein